MEAQRPLPALLLTPSVSARAQDKIYICRYLHFYYRPVSLNVPLLESYLTPHCSCPGPGWCHVKLVPGLRPTRDKNSRGEERERMVTHRDTVLTSQYLDSRCWQAQSLACCSVGSHQVNKKEDRFTGSAGMLEQRIT